jgi:hypothetical protein
MERHRRVRRSTVVTAIGAALAVSVFVPSLASGDAVGDLLGGGGDAVNDTVKGVTDTVGGATGGAGQRAGTPPNYEPPLHGTNPHGEGSIATVDINPSDTNPYPGNPGDGDEEIVIGQSRGEQNAGGYHGRVTLAYVNLTSLMIPVEEHIFIESNPGETNTGPAGPLNQAIEDNICDPTMDAVCLSVLSMNSSTSSTGSNNSFSLVSFGADLTGTPLGLGASTDAGTTSGNIQEGGGCQTASGTSSVAQANVTTGVVDPQATLLQGSSTSTACNNGQQSTTNSSSLATLTGLPVDPLVVVPQGCFDDTPNTTIIDPLLGVLSLVCNADDKNGSQAGAPYGVREALTAFVDLSQAMGPVLRLVFSGPESHAVAPIVAQQPTPTAPPPTTPPGPGGDQPAGEPGAEGAGPAAAEAAEGGDALPFTGQNLLLLGAIGAGLLGMGLAARRRRTV